MNETEDGKVLKGSRRVTARKPIVREVPETYRKGDGKAIHEKRRLENDQMNVITIQPYKE